MTALPGDLDVARQLVAVRASVIEATHHVRSPKRSTRYRTTRNLIIAGAAIAALTAGAIIVIQAGQDVIDSNAVCFHSASLDEPGVYVGGHPGDSDDPIQLCSVAWSANLWDDSLNVDDPNDGSAPVPPLVACTMSDGVAGVFPRGDSDASDEDFCETLGLADWGSD